MKQPTTKQIAAQIKRNNAKFKKASPAQKRVMIARDVIKRIESKQYKPSVGAWVGGFDTEDDNNLVQPLIVAGAKCCVCALGGVFMSCTALNNQQTAADFYRESDIGDLIVRGERFSNGLTRIFEPEQLCLIEKAFEMGNGFRWGCMNGYPNVQAVESAVAFGSQFSASGPRLLAIMRNIVKNKGTFRPK